MLHRIWLAMLHDYFEATFAVRVKIDADRHVSEIEIILNSNDGAMNVLAKKTEMDRLLRGQQQHKKQRVKIYQSAKGPGLWVPSQRYYGIDSVTVTFTMLKKGNNLQRRRRGKQSHRLLENEANHLMRWIAVPKAGRETKDVKDTTLSAATYP
jgi:hypothetical protein